MRKRSFLIIMFLLFFAYPGFSDIIYLKSGKIIEGEVISETDEKISIRLPMGRSGDIVYSVEKGSIEKIKNAPVSYDFFEEEDVDTEIISTDENRFSIENILKYGLKVFKGRNGEEISPEDIIKKLKAYDIIRISRVYN